jgi:hypothetical protein
MEVQELNGALFNIALVVMIVAVVESVADIAGEAVSFLIMMKSNFPARASSRSRAPPGRSARERLPETPRSR